MIIIVGAVIDRGQSALLEIIIVGAVIDRGQSTVLVIVTLGADFSFGIAAAAPDLEFNPLATPIKEDSLW